MLNFLLGYSIGILTLSLLNAIFGNRNRSFSERYSGLGDMYVDEFGLYDLEQDKYYH